MRACACGAVVMAVIAGVLGVPVRDCSEDRGLGREILVGLSWNESGADAERQVVHRKEQHVR